jgi:hypothetical protein
MHPGSPVTLWIADPVCKRAAIGIAMSLTAIGSANLWGTRSCPSREWACIPPERSDLRGQLAVPRSEKEVHFQMWLRVGPIPKATRNTPGALQNGKSTERRDLGGRAGKKFCRLRRSIIEPGGIHGDARCSA